MGNLLYTELNNPDISDNSEHLDMENELKELEKLKIFNEMDFKISASEIIKATKKLKKNKSTGLDSISNEMIKYSQHMMLSVLNRLFNRILNGGKYPKIWCKGYIIPIPKNTNTDLPTCTNHRGIAILRSLAKLFNAILNGKKSTSF